MYGRHDEGHHRNEEVGWVTEIAGADGYWDGRGWISGRVWMNMGYTSDKVVE
jgi:hypothetical protein